MAFLWEDYSADSNDKGVEVKIPFEGQVLPFRIRRRLSLDERQIANDAAFEMGFDKDGAPHLVKSDQGAYTREIVRIGLKKWPFEYSPGNPVPVTPANIAKLDGGLLELISKAILGATDAKRQQSDFLHSSEKKSDVGSSQGVQQDQS